MPLYKHTTTAVKGSYNALLGVELMGKKINLAHGGSTGGIASVTVTDAGNLTAVPTLGTSGNGSGAVLVPVLGALSPAFSSAGTGYNVGNVLTLFGGTFTTAAQLTVNSIGAFGAITAVTITNAGAYTAIPTGVISTTGGDGVDAQFTIHWKLLSVTVSSPGDGYDSDSQLTITGANISPAAGTLVLDNLGAAATISVTAFSNLPASYSVFVNPGQNCNCYTPEDSKTNSGFDVVLMPYDESVVIAPGYMDVFVSA